MRRAMEQGFTLLELLIAMVVLGIVLAVLTQGMHFGVLASLKHEKLLQRVSDLDVVDRTLRMLIEPMKPGSVTGQPPYFVGEACRLSFTSDLPTAFGLPAQEADVTLNVDAARRLRLSWTPHLAVQQGQAPAPDSTLLLDGVDHIELSYLGTEAQGAGWQANWRQPSLPDLIRIRIVFMAGSGRLFPDIVVAPRRSRMQR